MTIKASSMGNLPIITIDNGKKVSKVRDIIYDGQSNQVKALLIDEKGWFKGAKILLLNDINSIGQDAVIIKDEDCFVYSDQLNDNNIAVIVDDNNFMTKNKVITESGTDLGRVTDLYFDFPSGEVVTIEVSKGFMQNLGSGAKNINILDIVTIGEDNLIVRDLAEHDFEAQGQEQGVNKLLSDTKEKTTSFIDTAKEKIEDVIQSKPVQDAMEKTKEVASNTKEGLVNAYQNTKESIESGEAEKMLKDTMEKGKEVASNAKDSVVNTFDKAKDSIESGDAKQNFDDTMEKGREIASKSKDGIVNAFENAKESVESGQAEHKIKVTMDPAQEKVEQMGQSVHTQANKVYDTLEQEAITLEAQAVLDAKIHNSKKELKNAMKESKDNLKIDVR